MDQGTGSPNKEDSIKNQAGVQQSTKQQDIRFIMQSICEKIIIYLFLNRILIYYDSFRRFCADRFDFLNLKKVEIYTF